MHKYYLVIRVYGPDIQLNIQRLPATVKYGQYYGCTTRTPVYNYLITCTLQFKNLVDGVHLHTDSNRPPHITADMVKTQLYKLCKQSRQHAVNIRSIHA